MGPKYSTDEEQPRETGGHYMARSKLCWPGTIFFLWAVFKASFVISMRNNLFATPIDPLASMYICIPTLVVGTAAFLANMFYFGPQAKKKKKDKAGTNSTISGDMPMTRLNKWDLIARAANDQWLITVFTASTTFVLIFILSFYGQHGTEPFRPITIGSTPVDLDNRGVVRSFEDMLIAICGVVVLIALSTGADTLHRYVWHHAKAPKQYEMMKPTPQSLGNTVSFHGHEHIQ